MDLKDLKQAVRARSLCVSGEARAIRLAAGVSQADVGAVVGRDGASVYRWETGKQLPSTEDAIEYGRVLDGLAKAVADAAR